MKDFWKILRIFNLMKKKVKKEDLMLISNKYEELIRTYSDELCPNFPKESSLLIYYLDKEQINPKNLMNNVLENNNILSYQILNEIYIYLISISLYNDISKNIIDYIINYFYRKKYIEKTDDLEKCKDIIKIKIIEEKFNSILNKNKINIKSKLLNMKLFIK